MQISRAGEYGVLGLLHLVRQPVDQPIMIEAISRDESIPKSFLAKIFQDLARAGILRSQRGAGGGFLLARAADKISVLEVIEAIDGRIALQRCLGDEPDCERKEGCALCVLFEQAQDRLKDVFAQTSLAELSRRHGNRPIILKPGPSGGAVVGVAEGQQAPATAPAGDARRCEAEAQPIHFRPRNPLAEEIKS